jgi:hypothetical protein
MSARDASGAPCRLRAFNASAIASPERTAKPAPGNHGKGEIKKGIQPMQTENCSAYTSIKERNYQLALDPQQVSSIGAAFEQAWLKFTAAAPAGMDLFAEASIRQLIAVRIIRATQSGELDRDALITLALHGL